MAMARVLLVDDDAGVLDTCGAILRPAGLDVETAACGRRALDVLGGESFDLLLLDLKLPDTSGLEVLAETRRRGSTVPAVVITGYASLDSSVEAMRLGAVDYLSKPLFAEALVAAASRALGRGMPDAAVTSIADPAASTRAVAEGDAQDSGVDVPSVGRWAAFLRISAETLRRWCSTAGLDARASLDLARVLRAVRCAHEHGSAPARVLA